MERCDDSDTPVAFHEGSDGGLCRIEALPTDAATVQEPTYIVKPVVELKPTYRR